MNKSKATLLFKAGVRFSSADMSVKVQRKYGPLEVQRSQLMNGITVAAAKPLGCAQIGACTIMYRAGSRYEEDDMLGATHFLRAMSSCSGEGYTSYIKLRALQQHGGYLSVTSDRQMISYSLRCPPPLFGDLKFFLLDAAARCCFHSWEFDDRRAMVKEDLERIHPEQRVIDLVQKAMWTGPLSHSMFCEPERVDDFRSDDAYNFVNTHFRSDGCSVGSTGFDFEDVIRLAESINLVREKPPCPRNLSVSCPRGGFELYDLGACSDTWIALGIPGVGTSDYRALVKHAIIAAACGTGNKQRGQHTIDSTPQSPLSMIAGIDPRTSYKAFNISYLDTGMFGLVVNTRAACATPVAKAAAEFLSHIGELDEQQIEVGKQRLKLAVCLNDENCILSSFGLALQAANYIQINNVGCNIEFINQIPVKEIQETAQAMGKLSAYMAVAVVGDVSAVPTDRELVCGTK